MADHQPVKQVPNGREMQLDRRLRQVLLQAFYISRHMDALDVHKRQVHLLAPVQKPDGRFQIGAPGVRVPDPGREEFDEAVGGMGTGFVQYR